MDKGKHARQHTRHTGHPRASHHLKTPRPFLQFIPFLAAFPPLCRASPWAPCLPGLPFLAAAFALFFRPIKAVLLAPKLAPSSPAAGSSASTRPTATSKSCCARRAGGVRRRRRSMGSTSVLVSSAYKPNHITKSQPRCNLQHDHTLRSSTRRQTRMRRGVLSSPWLTEWTRAKTKCTWHQV